jgi:glycosyltransferase involved in cell wall biosynthesis
MIENKKTAVLGFVFPAVKEFVDDYLKSLENQTYKDFDLIVVNDGLNNFKKLASKYNLRIKEIPCSGCIAENRAFGINYVKSSGYEYVIFTDIDDFSAPNRVEKSLQLLENYDIVVNDITNISTKGDILQECYMSNRVSNLSKIDSDFLKDKNILGFTNTSMRLMCLKEDLSFDKDLIAVDWYMFSRILKAGHSAVFTNETTSFYRRYEGNVAGLSPDVNERMIKDGIASKLFHYRELSKTDNEYKALYEKFEKLNKDITDEKYRERYTQEARHLSMHKPLWWEQIRLPEELSL